MFIKLEIGRTLRNHLEKVCHNIVCDLFSIPKNSINFSLNIVDKTIQMQINSEGGWWG